MLVGALKTLFKMDGQLRREILAQGQKPYSRHDSKESWEWDVWHCMNTYKVHLLSYI